jgi:amino acid permease
MVHRFHAASAISASLKQQGMPMRALGATTVTSIILYLADQFVYDERHTEVLTGMLRQVGWLVGVHV